VVNEKCRLIGAKNGDHFECIMQNKANFRKGQININIFSTKDYEKIAHLETPAKQSQSKPIKPNLHGGLKMNANSFAEKGLRKCFSKQRNLESL
jgi:hypothetical protein